MLQLNVVKIMEYEKKRKKVSTKSKRSEKKKKLLPEDKKKIKNFYERTLKMRYRILVLQNTGALTVRIFTELSNTCIMHDRNL